VVQVYNPMPFETAWLNSAVTASWYNQTLYSYIEVSLHSSYVYDASMNKRWERLNRTVYDYRCLQ